MREPKIENVYRMFNRATCYDPGRLWSFFIRRGLVAFKYYSILFGHDKNP
jgi:hypothetical protein